MVKVSKSDLRRRVLSKATLKPARKSPQERGRPPVYVEFPRPLYERLEAAAARLGVSKSDVVREATASALDVLDTSAN